MISRVFLALSLLLFLAACKPKPSAQALTSPDTDGSGSVYDDVGQSGYGELDSGGEIMEDSINYDDGEISSTQIGLDGSGAEELGNLDLSWGPVFFGFDEAALSDTTKATLSRYAQVLNRNPTLNVLLEGHCDARGTEDYNVALGERRAQAVKQFMVNLGVSSSRLRTISYGEMKPLVYDENESAWARNRRVAFTF